MRKIAFIILMLFAISIFSPAGLLVSSGVAAINSGELAVITFRAIADGPADIHISEKTILVDVNVEPVDGAKLTFTDLKGVVAGEEYEVRVQVSNIPHPGLYAFDLVLEYNSNVLQAESLSEGNIFDGWDTFTVSNIKNNDEGFVWLAVTRLGSGEKDDPGDPGGGGGGGGGGTSTTPPPPVLEEPELPKLAADPAAPMVRLYGETRIQTAIEISKKLFPQEKSAAAVVLARADDFPDALAGAPLAYNVGGPLLLTNTSALHADTATEIARVLKSGGDVCVLGGTAAISDNVVQTLKDDGYSVSRLGGADRYETAVKIAEALGDAPEKAFLVTGQNFPDAVAASSAAARLRAPVLLTPGDSISSSTEGYLSENSIEDIYVIGGAAAISDTVYVAAGGTKRLGGADRWETAVQIAEEFFPAPQVITVATGLAFPDALSGGVLAAAGEAPVLLTHPERLPEATGGYILQASDMLVQTFVFGGPDAVSAGVFDKIAGLLP